VFNCENIPEIHYDFQTSIELMSNKESVARDLALMLKKNLPEFTLKLESAFKKNDVKEIHTIIHKLHGGICYVMAPRLEYLVEHLETACKKFPENIPLITPYIIPSIKKLEDELTHIFD
jgi:two-component system sensor histidine kinase BarA